MQQLANPGSVHITKEVFLEARKYGEAATYTETMDGLAIVGWKDTVTVSAVSVHNSAPRVLSHDEAIVVCDKLIIMENTEAVLGSSIDQQQARI